VIDGHACGRGSGTVHTAIHPVIHAVDREAVLLDDGVWLPLRTWAARLAPANEIVLLALHGQNDSANAFEAPATWLAERGITTYAYDQRGFGQNRHRGSWAGSDRMAADARFMLEETATRHPAAQLYLLGESMGAAVASHMLAESPPARIAGVILVAPAVWGRSTMPLYQRLALWLSARAIPWARLTGAGLGRRATDNDQALEALRRDPLTIHGTRVPTIVGLVELMDAAQRGAPQLAYRCC
jgi:acylglycerol lipase